jgi:hypothetical protein
MGLLIRKSWVRITIALTNNISMLAKTQKSRQFTADLRTFWEKNAANSPTRSFDSTIVQILSPAPMKANPRTVIWGLPSRKHCRSAHPKGLHRGGPDKPWREFSALCR